MPAEEEQETRNPANAETESTEETVEPNSEGAVPVSSPQEHDVPSSSAPPVSILHKTEIPRPHKHHERCVSFGEDLEACCNQDTEDLQATTESRMSDEGEESNYVRPTLFRDRRSASLAAMSSFRDSVSTLHNDCASGANRWKPWVSWSMPRLRWTACGCVSSIAVLTIRLLLDTEPTAYLIHSIIVFLDMVLIHLFTNSPWLSISGECLTIAFFLAFHFTKETLFELLETTLIAVLCSFHLILSRNKHKDRNQALQADLLKMRQSSIHLLRNVETLDKDDIVKLEEETLAHSVRTAPGGAAGWIAPIDKAQYSQKLKAVGENFFEHFLDGSAGVSFPSICLQNETNLTFRTVVSIEFLGHVHEFPGSHY